MQPTTEFPMKSKSINDGVERTFVLIIDQGEEAFKSPKKDSCSSRHTVVVAQSD
jgi:hypothetical protein